MNKLNYSLYTILILALIAAGCSSNNDTNNIKPTYRDISEFVYASAKVVSQNTYQSRPSRSGIISEIFIKEGDKIKKGQPLFRIKSTAESDSKLANASVNLNEAKENLLGYNNKLNSLKVELQRISDQNLIDSINYQRRKRLWKENIGSKNQLEQSKLVYQSSSSRLKVLELDLRQTKLKLQSEYDKARNQVTTEKRLIDDLEIKSELDGVVHSLRKEVGEYISPQEIFAAIGSNDNFILKINIDEVDISRIEIGDTAIINLEAYPNEVYTSVLTYIANIKDETTQTFQTEGMFTKRPPKLFNGLSGEANILITKRKNAIVIPSEYLLDRNKVLTKDGPIDIIVGVKNIEFVEILSGIDSTTVLLKPEEL